MPWSPPDLPSSVIPDEAFEVGAPDTVNHIEFADGGIEINEGRETITVVVVNTGDRPIQVGAHYHLAEANKALAFDRAAAFGFRLDIASGTSVRFEPGQSRECQLTRFAGAEVAMGMNDITNGSMRSDATKLAALARLREQSYRFEDHQENGAEA